MGTTTRSTIPAYMFGEFKNTEFEITSNILAAGSLAHEHAIWLLTEAFQKELDLAEATEPKNAIASLDERARMAVEHLKIERLQSDFAVEIAEAFNS